MQERFSTQELTTMALLAALLCVSSYISIQLPISAVPITAQTLVINMIALLLKPRKAGITVVVWILLGAVGLPVFSGGKAGFGTIAGPTGGYIIAYFVAVIIISFLKSLNRTGGGSSDLCPPRDAERGKSLNRSCENKIPGSMGATFVGIAVIYGIGVPWMRAVTGIGWTAAVVTGVLPFLAGDVIKCIAAVYICKPLYRIVNMADDSVKKTSENQSS